MTTPENIQLDPASRSSDSLPTRFAGSAAVILGFLSVMQVAMIYDRGLLFEGVAQRIVIFAFIAIIVVAGFKNLRFSAHGVFARVLIVISIAATALLAIVAAGEQGFVSALLMIGLVGVSYKWTTRWPTPQISVVVLAFVSLFKFIAETRDYFSRISSPIGQQLNWWAWMPPILPVVVLLLCAVVFLGLRRSAKT